METVKLAGAKVCWKVCKVLQTMFALSGVLYGAHVNNFILFTLKVKVSNKKAVFANRLLQMRFLRANLMVEAINAAIKSFLFWAESHKTENIETYLNSFKLRL